ncbi:TlpA family protein disulfide reductase [Ekhidna lutea]|uniref:TlpA family protein disulfide reductase n=1 Tax=Ekhidna lutea TaxID=447679 RepID=UPI0015C68EB4|nr:TlpA disulfide reductase family protein [Ekhidna lutea]
MNKLVFLFLPLLFTCCYEKINHVEVVQNDTQIDSLFISEIITERKFQSISTLDAAPLKVDSTIIATIKTSDGKGTYLTIIRPNRDLKITINKDSSLTTNHIADSLLNYLWHSQNAFLGKHSSYIFTSNDTDSLLSTYSTFGKQRASTIEQFSEVLTDENKTFLHYHNTARLNSFLLYYGKFIKSIPYNDDYYGFIDEIENNNRLAKTFPTNLLSKHEINYLNQNDTIVNIISFLAYIDDQTKSKDLSDYLKATYLREIIEDPSEWKFHQPLLRSDELKMVLKREKNNPYYNLIESTTDSYFSSQEGEKAYDFTATRPDGTQLKLSDLRGKLVFIDNWASWCGPCIKHRPIVLEMAERFQDDPKIEVLMISVDASKKDWEDYLTKKDQINNNNDLIIENGMNEPYGERFNIKSIPKYMLIDQDGVIINADLPNPSDKLIELINAELEKI